MTLIGLDKPGLLSRPGLSGVYSTSVYNFRPISVILEIVELTDAGINGNAIGGYQNQVISTSTSRRA